MKAVCCAVSSVGRVRSNNEDNYYVNGICRDPGEKTAVSQAEADTGNALFAVFDGMGGEAFGDLASYIGVNTLDEYRNGEEYGKPGWVDQFVYTFNQRVCELIERNNGIRSGSTMALLWLENDRAHACNIGDSRIYHFRNGEMRQLSHDHTEAQRKVRLGLMAPEQVRTSSSRHVLTQCIGIPEEEMAIEPYCAETFPAECGDCFLLCSDGLTEVLTDEELRNILARYPASPFHAAKALTSRALSGGARDNVTAVVIAVR